MNEKGKVSYSVGYQVGSDFHRQGIKLDPDDLLQGVRDGLAAAEPRLPPDEMRQILVDLKHRVEELTRQQMLEKAIDNRAAGEAFLEQNAERPGVIALQSGLQYEVLRDGEGASPTLNDTVRVHYRGALLDGTVFDTSYGRGQPERFRVTGLIPGWSEGLQLMKPGSHFKLYIPPGLAYGDRGAGPRIPPGSTLVFEVELLAVMASEG